jgi:ribonuclease VapC
MIVDTSAILAILLQEVDARQYAEAIHVADACRMSAANFLEAAINPDSRLGPAAGRQLDTFVERSLIVIEPGTVEQARIARQAYLDYGKGYHPAGLNSGDVFAYALSKTTRQPLLFKGNDFSRTDIEVFLLIKFDDDESYIVFNLKRVSELLNRLDHTLGHILRR